MLNLTYIPTYLKWGFDRIGKCYEPIPLNPSLAFQTDFAKAFTFFACYAKPWFWEDIMRYGFFRMEWRWEMKIMARYFRTNTDSERDCFLSPNFAWQMIIQKVKHTNVKPKCFDYLVIGSTSDWLKHQFLNIKRTQTCSSLRNQTQTPHFWLWKNEHQTCFNASLALIFNLIPETRFRL